MLRRLGSLAPSVVDVKMLAISRTRVVSKGKYSSLPKSVYWVYACAGPCIILTSLLGRGARTCVRRNGVLIAKRLTGSRVAVSKAKYMDGDAQRKGFGSCDQERVKAKVRKEKETARAATAKDFSATIANCRQ